jgi:uncharacterized membrane protein
MSPAQTPAFEALIVPYRSLTRRGMITVVAVSMAMSSAVALRFWWLGAWPVTVFCLLASPLFLFLLAVNLHHARASELIMLNPHEVTIIQTDPAGRTQHQSLPSAWLRIDLETAKGASRVLLSSRGRDCEVGAFLHEPDRLALFEALRDALHGVRNPRFDNPQLRDE